LKNISIFGTSSDSGKSTITFALGRILNQLGYKTTPFKAQNVSNNSSVADDGSEIAVSTAFQAEAMNAKSTYHINPVLLKSSYNSWQLVLNGKVANSLEFKKYYEHIDMLKPEVKKSFEYLDREYDIVIAEGAGSPVELNLMSKDLSNTYIAQEFDTKIILVADIERGGVFASIYGVYNLLSQQLRDNVIGVIINKFRGDVSFFDEGIEIIEKDFGIPVLGIMPYFNTNLAYEDSYSLINYKQNREYKIKVALIKYPHISNFNDIEPLIADSEIYVDFVDYAKPLDEYDAIILPGTKMTIQDLRWLKEKKIFDEVKRFNKKIFAICGGYQMLFENLIDIDGVENSKGEIESGFGYIDDTIEFREKKILKNGEYEVFDNIYSGFEIHCGTSKKYPLYFQSELIDGTFLHSIFDNDDYRDKCFKNICSSYNGYSFSKYRKNQIDEFCDILKKNINIKKIIDNLN
jgi:adenosylcobyric acid synthase